MASGAVLSYRNDLEEKLNAKRSELLETEETLKKYVGDVATRPSFRGRLGPLPQRDNVQARLSLDGHQRRQPVVGRGRLSLEGRLGPKVIEDEEEDVEEGRKVMSRVVVEQKSREEALKEKKADKAEVQRSKRMFGSLLGTLQRFRQDENKVKERELKKREIELKIEEKTEKEKDEAKKKKQELFTDLEKHRQQFRLLQAQMKRVQEFETWEKNKRLEAKFIRTKKSPHIYYLPKEHNDVTMTALEETIDLVEEEIKAARIKFDEDIKKLSEMMDNPAQDTNLEDEEQEDDGKNLSSVVSAVQKPEQRKQRSPSPPPPPTSNRRQRHKSRSSSGEDESDKEEKNGKKESSNEERKQEESETKKVEAGEEREVHISKEAKTQNEAEVEKTKSAEKVSPKPDRKSSKSDNKKSSGHRQRKRSAKSSSSSSSASGSSSSSSSDSSSDSSDDDESSKKKKKNGSSKKKARRGSSSD